jgi:hypothetical protein
VDNKNYLLTLQYIFFFRILGNNLVFVKLENQFAILEYQFVILLENIPFCPHLYPIYTTTGDPQKINAIDQ